MRRPGAAVTLTAAAAAAVVLTAGPAALASTATTWQPVYHHHYGAAANQNGFDAVVAPGRNQAWAFGGSDNFGGVPIAARWTGGRWRYAALPVGLTSGILAASASSASNVWAVSRLGQAVLRWNGHRWSVAKRWPKSDQGELTGVTALSRTNVWVFGSGGFTGGLGSWHYNGRNWTHETSGPVSGVTLASGVSATDMWAIGDRKAPQDSIVRYHDGHWKFQSARVLAGRQFNSVLALSATNVWAVAAQQTNNTHTFLLHYNGRQWSQLTVPGGAARNGQLFKLTADGHGGFWLQSTKRLLHRVADRGWATPRAANPQVSALAAVPGRSLLIGAGAGPAATANSSDAVVSTARLG